GMVVGSGVMFIAVTPKLGVSTVSGIRRTGEVQAWTDRDRHQRRRYTAALRGAGAGEEGKRYDHRGALQQGRDNGSGGRDHELSRSRHYGRWIWSAWPPAGRRGEAAESNGAGSRT